MVASSEVLHRVLEATGFYPDGEPARGLHLGSDARGMRRRRSFAPDAAWRSSSAFTVYFKFETEDPPPETVSSWRREIWNEGFAPLLWVVSPERIQLFNGYAAPQAVGDSQANRIATFRNVESALQQLDALAGRLALETGSFWRQKPEVNRKTSVDERLLADLQHLEAELVSRHLRRLPAQALIGRTIFTQYLIDRKIVTGSTLQAICGLSSLPTILRERSATIHLFSWLNKTFNGDMFPEASVADTPKASHLATVSEFLEARDAVTGQLSLFPYQFDVIPVELISSIYEQFAHSASASARSAMHGVHYTRLPTVNLVLDEVTEGLTGTETVLDLTCGSGVFLVEALRRLVAAKSAAQATRSMVREALYTQVYGVDISEAAIRVAAFSLYLAALELDPDPQPPEALKFRPLIGKTLFVGDAHSVDTTDEGKRRLRDGDQVKKFDLIVGNPPWSYKGKRGTAKRRTRGVEGLPVQPRGESLDFLVRAVDFSHSTTRFGIILGAAPFFSGSSTGAAATLHALKQLAPVTLVNLSALSSWLFETASAPAVILFARHRPQRADQVTVVQIPWSETGARTHTFDVAPSDVMHLTIAEIEQTPFKLKTAAVGRRRDLGLVDNLIRSFNSVGAEIEAIGGQIRDGLTRGSPSNQTRDARLLKGLPFLQADDLDHMRINVDELPAFSMNKAQWPRSRETYNAPLVVIKEMMKSSGRAGVAVSERDLVFTDSFFAVSLPQRGDLAHLLAGIFSSSFSSWFFTMTAAEFGVWKRKLLRRDVTLLPSPDLVEAANSENGKRVIELSRSWQVGDQRLNWVRLDEAVLDLYALSETDRIVVRDGLLRAGWQWDAGRTASVKSATADDLRSYAQSFLSVMAAWLGVRNERHMRAEIVTASAGAAVRVIRFVLEEEPGVGAIALVDYGAEVNGVLRTIGERLQVRIASALRGTRELRIHGRNELFIVKPAAKRHWLPICGLDDADSVVAESFTSNLPKKSPAVIG